MRCFTIWIFYSQNVKLLFYNSVDNFSLRFVFSLSLCFDLYHLPNTHQPPSFYSLFYRFYYHQLNLNMRCWCVVFLSSLVVLTFVKLNLLSCTNWEDRIFQNWNCDYNKHIQMNWNVIKYNASNIFNLIRWNRGRTWINSSRNSEFVLFDAMLADYHIFRSKIHTRQDEQLWCHIKNFNRLVYITMIDFKIDWVIYDKWYKSYTYIHLMKTVKFFVNSL